MKHLMSIAAAVVAATLLTASSCEFVDKLWKKADVSVVNAEEAAPAHSEEAPATDVVVEDVAPVAHDHDHDHDLHEEK